MNNKPVWIFRNGTQDIPCSSFPYAFRTMYNVVRNGIANKKPVSFSTLSILGPLNARGDRITYSYVKATNLAKEQGLLTADDQINSREFKRR